MFGKVANLVASLAGAVARPKPIRLTAPAQKRSPLWPALRVRWLKEHPFCAACGSRENVVPHHKLPVHVDPGKQLVWENLISLCEGDAINCHLLIGHLRDWKSWNSEVEHDARIWWEKIQARPAGAEIPLLK